MVAWAVWLLMAAVAGVAALAVVYALAVGIVLLGTPVAMAVAGLRAWCRERRERGDHE